MRIQPWEASDAFWERVNPSPLPELDKEKSYKRIVGGGRKPIPYHQMLEGIAYVLRTGCQWKALPKERFGNPSNSRIFQPLDESGILPIPIGLQVWPNMMRWEGFHGNGRASTVP